jgi:glycosyltransferase involved in cell wall biosynthesis
MQPNNPHQPGSVASPLRIVHIVKHCGYGNGSVHVAVDLACMQARQGHDVTFVSSGGTFEPLLAQYGVRLMTLPHEQKKPLDVLAAAWKLFRFSRSTRPDLIHAHMMSSALVGYAAAKLSGVPLITTVHNSFDSHSFIMRLGDRVVAVSEAERNELLKKGYGSSQVVAVVNGADNSPREPFMRDEITPAIQRPCILAACGLHRRKGVFDLIAAWIDLSKEFPHWRLYIAGEGPDREVLERQASTAGLADRTSFLGFLRAPKPLMEQADIFVLASYADPCSLSIGEARSAGCAIVASSVGGTPEMLDFGKTGRLFAAGNVAQLTQELRQLMADDAARLKLRADSLAGSEIFDVVRVTADYERVYREAIQLRPRKQPSPSAVPVKLGN